MDVVIKMARLREKIKSLEMSTKGISVDVRNEGSSGIEVTKN